MSDYPDPRVPMDPASGMVLEVWTGTNPNGTYSGSACSNWTNETMSMPYATVGLTNESGPGWTQKWDQYCNRTTIHVYCFEQ